MDLPLFWFVMLGTLMAGYAVLDGFDLGVGALHLLARGDDERRVLLNAIGPVWDGNEVWLVVFGGALFASFPKAYAAAFSAFYVPFMFLLWALIFRAVAIEFRSKRESRAWRNTWDVAFFVASSLSGFLFGVAIGAVLRGISIGADGEFHGSLTELVTPWSLLVGCFGLSLFTMHGAVYLLGKTEGELHQRVRGWVWTACGVFFALYLFTTIVTLIQIPRSTANFESMPWIWGVVFVNVLAAANIPRCVFLDRSRQAFFSSALTILCLVVLFGVAMFPNLLTSSLDPAYSLTLANSSSSEKTLRIMRLVAFLGMPFVLTYTGVVYWVFRGRVKVEKHSY